MDENHVSRKLEERIKELNTLYRTSKIITQSEGDLEATLKRIAEVIPTGWQYPEICTCRIGVDDVVATSSRFKEGKWKQSEDIFLHGKKVGRMEVFYLADRPESDEGPFLLEERNLIIELSDRISEFLKIRESQRELDHVQRRYEDLFGEADEAIIYFELNPDNDPLKISFCNANMEGLLGYGPMELKGKDVYSIIGGDQRDKLRSIIRESCTEREMDRELVLVRHDGEGVACRASVNTIRLSSRRMALLVLKE